MKYTTILVYQGLIPSNKKNSFESLFEYFEIKLYIIVILIAKNKMENKSIVKLVFP